MAFSLPRLPPVAVTPQDMQIWWQQVVEAIEAQEGRQDDAIAAIAAAQAAADAANAAAATADAAAASAQDTADDITAANALATSYVTGATITATDAGADVTITISAHTRHYPQPDGSTVDVAVSGGSLTGRAYSTTYYIYYDDPSRAGGAVTYQSTTSEATAAQIGDRHTVGGVTTPAALGAPKTGGYTRPPGPGQVGDIP
jgi:hypothetical protein